MYESECTGAKENSPEAGLYRRKPVHLSHEELNFNSIPVAVPHLDKAFEYFQKSSNSKTKYTVKN